MLANIPVDPDADTARDWAVDELARPEYREGSGLSLDPFWQWLANLFDRIGDVGGSLGIPGAVIVGVLVAALLALVTWLVLGPLRRARRGAASGAVFDDDERSWREMRDSARAAAARQDWDLATMEWFRAAVRFELERGAIMDSAGVTAREAATRIADAGPHARAAVLEDADAFDAARYGSGGLAQSRAQHAERTFVAIESRRTREDAPA